MQETLGLIGHNSGEKDTPHGKWKMDATDVASFTRENVMMLLSSEGISAQHIAEKIIVENELSRNVGLRALYVVMVEEILGVEVSKGTVQAFGFASSHTKPWDRRYMRVTQ